MRAHEWTRARQRSVRQISGPLGDSAEEEAAEAAAPEPSLLTDEPEADVEPVPGEEPPEVLVEGPPAEDLAEPWEPDEPPDQPLDEVADQVADRVETEPEEEERQATPDDGVPPEPAREPVPTPARAPRARRRPSTGAEQAQLPLGLEPVVEKPARRSATETREDLIQRLLDPHLTLQETAKLLNVCPTTVRRYTNRGLLAHYRTPGNQRRFRLSDVLAFMERQGIPAHGLERKRSTLIEEAQEPEEDAS